MAANLRIDLLGESFSLVTDADELYLQTLYSNYRTFIENTQKSTGIGSPLKVAIIAGLKLYDELDRLKTGMNNGAAILEAKEAEESLGKLIKKMDEALAIRIEESK